MNIVNKLTIRHLKQNKRRTLVTIIGVIISVAMVMAVATLGISFMDVLQRQSITDNGKWHVLYKDVNKAQLEAVKADEATQTVVISRDRGYASLEGGRNPNKPYLFIREYNTQGFELFPIELSQGRFPQASNEIVISEEIAKSAKVDYKIGDSFTLKVGERFSEDKEDIQRALTQNDPLRYGDNQNAEILKNTWSASYTVVGVIKRPAWEQTWAPGYTILSYFDESMIGANDKVNAAVVLNKVKSTLYTHAGDLAKANTIDPESVAFNNNLLRYYGITNNDGLRSTLYSLTAIIMMVIVIGSVSLIYNAFAISVSERSRHLGMLSSVGATRRQKRNSVFFEGMVIGVISIPIGIISGLVGIGITFMFMNAMIQGALWTNEKLKLIVTPLSILITCLVSMLTIFISTYFPAIKASKVSAMDAIRQTADVKLTVKAVKTSKFIRKLFGLEAEIGLKNLKRNKRRYHAIVFSLVISIVLYMTVSYFTAGMTQSLELSRQGVNYDIEVSYSNGKRIDDHLMQAIVSLSDVTAYNVIQEFYMNAWVDEAFIADELQERVQKDKGLLQDGKYPYDIKIHALDDSSLQAYAKAVGADYEQLTDPDRPAAIVMDRIHYKDKDTGKYVQTKAIFTNVGQRMELTHSYKENDEKTKDNKVIIAALTDQAPMGMNSTGVGGLNMIMSERVMNLLADDKDLINASTYLHLKSTEPMRTQQEIEELYEINLNVNNVYHSRRSEEQQIVLMSVFSYGFILLISAISIANIFNTISTGLALRKREFAMLKSVGMTPKGFSKMMNYENIFYGIKSLLFGLPVSLAVMVLIYNAFSNKFSYGFTLPWMSILSVIVAVFVIVGSAIAYSGAKVKKENIIDALKQENI
ncbi:ABC transporter permease [Paenibacillus sp. 1001270B_150601_E10]|uniref:ABC transporter permease n=1 Tax=Paenibacillus sp. 1001270B_150601_E10 TaxID=2787079 RepID=UPI00189DA360|nr:FtsX-like permease family protein [Paenibacillus sp. 1001270B_150601_E10]